MKQTFYPDDRRNRIIGLIKAKNGKMTVKELANNIEISQSALYKDLKILEKQRFIEKSYGKIKFIESGEKKHNFFLNMQKNAEQKKAIGKQAALMVNDDETIFVDGSSTTFYFCEEIKKRKLKNITLITNSIFIPREMIMDDNINIIIVGGMVNKFIGTSDGDVWERLVKDNFYADKFFFSCYSMSTEAGILDPIQADSSMKAVFALKSRKKICLIDSSKFSLYSTFNWLDLDSIDLIITDSAVNNKIYQKLVARKIEVIIAK